MFRRITRLGNVHVITFIVHDFADDVTMVNVLHDEENTTEHRMGINPLLTVEQAEAWLVTLPDYEEIDDPGEAAIAILDEVLPMLTDEQAEQVPQAFPAWESGVAYAVGDRRRYDGRLYRCVQAHTSQAGWEPDKTPALWVRTSTDPIPEWVQPTGAQDAYALGDRVRHSGKVWESLVDANVWEPSDAVPTLWAEVS